MKLPGTFLIGLFLGWLVLRTGSLWPAIVVHLANNLMAVVGERLAPGSAEWTPSWAVILLAATVGLTGLTLLLSPQVRKRIRELNSSP